MNEDRQLLGPTSVEILEKTTRWRSPVITITDQRFTWWARLLYALRHPIGWLRGRRAFRGLGIQHGLSGWEPINPKNPAPPRCEFDPVGYDFAAGKTFEITKEKK